MFADSDQNIAAKKVNWEWTEHKDWNHSVCDCHHSRFILRLCSVVSATSNPSQPPLPALAPFHLPYFHVTAVTAMVRAAQRLIGQYMGFTVHHMCTGRTKAILQTLPCLCSKSYLDNTGTCGAQV